MGFELRQNPSGLEMVNKFIEKIKSAIEKAKFVIYKIQEDMMQYYNQRRSLALVFKLGNQIYLDMSDIKTTRLSPKLLYCRLGPFEIECQVGPLAYLL